MGKADKIKAPCNEAAYNHDFNSTSRYLNQGPCDLKLGMLLLAIQGPVVQSVVSLTSSLRVISLTVLADSIYNILLFFC